ncbi:hypothetical protein LNTAR_19812 [Lentisphaera araneosa HTCC2155]|jgi:hypothetical protein|uniref:Uncharacterized protein n=1 Tax=Lentisphaera araneosa HTCC2155 TaxID=313628 RepID=A6DPQ7_9BACT|nr:hypothetical protein [Lentisphaera araneosa]EDM26352.1 hypothetical protein LNTAR_19812 [Lentisphaera araneosa HTCC2155]
MKLIMACLFIGSFISCAHAPNETSADPDKVEKKADTETDNIKTQPSNGGLDL